MNVNHDPSIVIMDRRQFNDLLFLAAVGEAERGVGRLNQIKRHLRRWNTQLQIEATQRLATAIASNTLPSDTAAIADIFEDTDHVHLGIPDPSPPQS